MKTHPEGIKSGLQRDFAAKACQCLAELCFAIGAAYIASAVFQELT